MKVLLVDNYDSFTYNLKQLLDELTVDVDVIRNDQIDFKTLEQYNGIILSPGPGVPERAGDLKKVIQETIQTKPILGICLGMQAIGEVLGCELALMDRPIHGRATKVTHSNNEIFEGLPAELNVGRYHSWIINKETLNDRLEIISTDDQARIMGIKAREYPTYGLQFHPESLLTEYGKEMISNFINQMK